VVKRPSSYQGHSEQVNVHVDTSRGGDIGFVLCAIETHPACLCSSCADAIQEEEKTEYKAPELKIGSEFRLVNLSFPDMLHL